MSVHAALTGGFFPENWDLPLAMGLGVVITGFLGDTVAGFISQFIPAEWLNPATEIIIGVVLFFLGGMGGFAGISSWLRMASLGAFAVGIADAVSILLGLVMPTTRVSAVRVRTPARVAATPQSRYRVQA